MKCGNCGASIHEGMLSCQYCGSFLPRKAQPEQPSWPQEVIHRVVHTYVEPPERTSNRGKWPTFFICMILGSLGAHRFYTGKYFTGFLWLITFGVFGMGWLADLLLLLMGGFRDSQGRRLV